MINQFKILLAKEHNEQSLKLSQALATKLDLEIVNPVLQLEAEQLKTEPPKTDCALFEYVNDKLCLNLLLDGKQHQLSFDLFDGEIGFRAERVSRSNETIAKAIGCKPHYRPKVLDATAGMGRDSLIMATLGCRVIMQERNFAIYQLLENALMRFKKQPDFSAISQRLSLAQLNSINSVAVMNEVDVIYLDPMFPMRKKTALVKKEMRLFKLLAGEDLDADELFSIAMQSQAKRVVVKRPKGAPTLNNLTPNHEIIAKKFRYDVYLNQG